MPHINELLQKFPIGIKVLFTHEVQKWQKLYNEKNDNFVTPVNELPTIKHTILPSMTINLVEVLNETNTGKMIFNYYKLNKKLNNNIRNLLVDTIISFIITKKMTMSVQLASNIGTLIVEMFPSEVKVCIIYLK